MVADDGKVWYKNMKGREFLLRSPECDRIRKDIVEYANSEMNGLDIGTNGSPLYIQSISLDLYKECGLGNLVQIKGDARSLYWFNDNVLDYVFSSHCLEDLTLDDKVVALNEWIRVLRGNCYLILYLPDEKKYRSACIKAGNIRNVCHKDAEFNMNKMRRIINENFSSVLDEVLGKEYAPYNFLLVYKKKEL